MIGQHHHGLGHLLLDRALAYAQSPCDLGIFQLVDAMHQEDLARPVGQAINSRHDARKQLLRRDNFIGTRGCVLAVRHRHAGLAIDAPVVTVVVDPDIDGGTHQKSSGIGHCVGGAVLLEAHIGGMQQIFGIGAAACPLCDASQNPGPEFPAARNFRHSCFPLNQLGAVRPLSSNFFWLSAVGGTRPHRPVVKPAAKKAGRTRETHNWPSGQNGEIMTNSLKLNLGTSFVALFAAATIATAAQAQETNAAAADSVEAVTVTGTSFRGVAPVGGNLVSVGQAVIEKTAAQNAQQILKNVPAITGLGMSGVTQNAGNSYYAPTIHSLGASASNSTLILIDGHRIPLGHISLALPDPSMVPAIALERVEVLAEGASSVYGSDAVAGVVNFITRKHYEGIMATAQIGTGDDFGTLSAGLLGGTSWQGGSVLAALGYSHSGSLRYDYSTRPYLQPNKTPYGGTNFQTFNCSPAAIQPAGSSTIFASPTAAAAIANTTANSPCDSQQYGSVYGKETRYNMMFRAQQDIGDDITLSGDFIYSSRQTFTPQSRGTIQATVFRTGAQANPFYVNPPGVVAGTTAGNSQTIRWDANELLGPGRYQNNTAPVWTGTLNAEWRIDGNWRATAVFLEGQDRTAQVTSGALCQSCATLALNGTTNTSGSLTAVVPGTTLTPTTTAVDRRQCAGCVESGLHQPDLRGGAHGPDRLPQLHQPDQQSRSRRVSASTARSSSCPPAICAWPSAASRCSMFSIRT